MTSLLRLLAAILGTHIQRDDLPPEQYVAVGIDYGFPAAMHLPAEVQRPAPSLRDQRLKGPCWLCGRAAPFDLHWCGGR